MDKITSGDLHIPGGKIELKDLLYRFNISFPFIIFHKLRWYLNKNLSILLPILNFFNSRLTVINRLGAPGDTLITVNVIHCIKLEFPKLRINVITPYDELIKYDPIFCSINSKETFFSTDSSYIDLATSKATKVNAVEYILNNLGIINFVYKGRFIMIEKEHIWAEQKLSTLKCKKPVIAICTQSKEEVKNWPTSRWAILIEKIKDRFDIIQLGDESEPWYNNTHRFAGYLSMRESASILSLASYFIGPDSLLMHIANALNIPSTIIFGGSRPVNAFGYSSNQNLSTKPKCSPCWIHKDESSCQFYMKCMDDITVEKVINTIDRL